MGLPPVHRPVLRPDVATTETPSPALASCGSVVRVILRGRATLGERALRGGRDTHGGTPLGRSQRLGQSTSHNDAAEGSIQDPSDLCRPSAMVDRQHSPLAPKVTLGARGEQSFATYGTGVGMGVRVG